MTSVVTEPSLAGQLVTVGAQDVTVYTVVVYTVEVVYGVVEAAAVEVSVGCDSIEVVGDERAPRADEVLEVVVGDE
jgi:hypothetical protein